MDSAAQPSDEARLLELAAVGDSGAWHALVQLYHDRLRRMVAIRLDQRLRGRLDPSDVLQDVYINALERLPEYLNDRKLPFFLWLRLITGDRLARLHRYHLGTQARDAGREMPLVRGLYPESSSAALAAQLLGDDRSCGETAIRAEQLALIQDALAQLDPLDREVLALRHFEQLTSPEAAQVLEISPAAAAKRYFRAVQRLRDVMANFPGGLEGFRP